MMKSQFYKQILCFTAVVLSLLGAGVSGNAEELWMDYDFAKLDFIPYTSSFVAKKKGHLFYGNKGYNEYQPLALKALSEPIGTKVLQSSLNRMSSVYELPVIDKFELLRRTVLNAQSKSRLDYNRNDLFNPKGETWEGLCNQWSGAALEPAISKLVASLVPVTCGDVTLYPSEIRELVTTFYVSDGTKEFYGTRNNKGSSIRENFETILGHDDLPPQLFHQIVFDRLKDNQGVVLDKEHSDSVWNHPIYKADAKSSVALNLDEVNFQSLVAVPLDFVFSHDTTLAAKLRNLSDEEKYLRLRTDKLIEDQINFPKWYDKYFRLDEAALNRDIHGFYERKVKLLGAGGVKFAHHINARMVKTTLWFIDESPFGSGGLMPDTKYSVKRDFHYWLFERDQKVVGSSWITSALERPDFIWVPKQKISMESDIPKISPQMGELYAIIRKCSPEPEVANFYHLVDESLLDNQVDEVERHRIFDLWSQVKTMVDREWVRQRYEGAQGISPSDF